MSDKGLIEELRGFHTLCGDPYCDHGDATDSEHCAACQAEFPCSAIRAAAALADRQPSEDDREALKRIAEVASEQRLEESIGEWREALGAGIDSFPDDWELEFWHAGYKHGALAMIEHQLSRAAVPNAATEREIAVIEEHREKWMARAFRAEAERDAALAAIERVRAIHAPFEGEGGHKYCGDCSFAADNGKPIFWPCPTVAALDGAPEPEVKP